MNRVLKRRIDLLESHVDAFQDCTCQLLRCYTQAEDGTLALDAGQTEPPPIIDGVCSVCGRGESENRGAVSAIIVVRPQPRHNLPPSLAADD
jgi:hypothetical protein